MALLERWERRIFWLGVIALAMFLIAMVSDILLPFVVGLLVAYFLDPAADKLEDIGFSRSLATATITISFFSLVILFSALVLPLLYEQLMILVQALPEYIANLQEKTSPLLAKITSFIDQGEAETIEEKANNHAALFIGWVGKILRNLWSSGIGLLNILSLVFISPVVSFYLLRDWDRITAKVNNLLPREYASTIRKIVKDIDLTLSGYIRGQSHVCLFLAIFYASGLLIVGLNFGLVIGILTGVFAFIPYVGLLVGMATGMGVAFFQFEGEWLQILAVFGVFIIGQALEGSIITPKLVGDKVQLHPVWIIFGLLAGGTLFGFTGVILAIPVTAILGVLIRFVVQTYMSSSYYQPSPLKKVAKKAARRRA